MISTPLESERDTQLQKLAEVRAENQRLKRELLSYRLGKRLLRFWVLGPSLSGSLETWKAEYEASPGRLPWRRVSLSSSIDVFSALASRQTRSMIVVALAASLPAVLTAYLLWQQNTKIDQQIQLTAAAQASQMQAEVSAVTAALFKSIDELCLPNEPEVLGILDYRLQEVRKGINSKQLPKFVAGMHRCWGSLVGSTGHIPLFWTRLYLETKDGVTDDFRVGLPALNVVPGLNYSANLDRPRPPDNLLNRAISLSEALVPYRQLEEQVDPTTSPTLSTRLSSPERGALLRAFAATGLATGPINFSRAWAPGISLVGVNLYQANLSSAYIQCGQIMGSLHDAILDDIIAYGVKLTMSDLRHIRSAHRADFRFAWFAEVILPTPEKFRGAQLVGADFDGAFAPQDRWLAKARQLPDGQGDGYRYVPVKATAPFPGEYWRMEATEKSKDSGDNLVSELCSGRPEIRRK